MSDDARPLFRILYRSRCAISGSDPCVEAEIEQILRQSEVANARAGLTGALLLTQSTFVQALEGPGEALEATFERICCDLRHSEVQLLEFTRIEERTFGEWSMGRVHADGAVSRLFAQLDASEPAGSPSPMADQAVGLMRTLIQLESLHPQVGQGEDRPGLTHAG